MDEIRMETGALGVKDKVVAITGGFGSLGIATAAWLIAHGARVALIGRGAAPAKEALLPGVGEATGIGGIDLTDAAAAREALDAVNTQLGGLDALLNIAGAFRWETVADGDPASWDLMYELNVKTALNASRAALPHLLRGKAGRIVNIGAGAGLKAGLGTGAYGAAKAGVARLTEALAEELKDKGVTVNAVVPSIIDTPQNRKDMPDADFTRWVAPHEIAALIGFLLSAEAQAITGALIPVNGRV
jgi:NAD(P)-dependent dehydrogenase (short-subunit alcohol dehydrogenase family)